MKKLVVVLVLVLSTPAFSYTVVRKDGKKFDGVLIRESAVEVIMTDTTGVTIRFKKEQIDWDKTTAARQSEEKTTPKTPLPKTVEIKRTPKEPGWIGEPISIDFKDIDIRDLFRFLAETGDVNLVIDPAVKGTVTIKMKEVPWDQVLDVVCKIHGLGYTIDGNVVSIDQ